MNTGRIRALKWWQWVLIVSVVSYGVGLFLPEDSPKQNVAGTAAQDAETAQKETESEENGCSVLPLSVMTAITSGEQEGVGMIPVRGAYVKSPDFKNVYFMAIEFKATGIENQVGVWARNGIESGLILSVDGFAKAFTVWPDASQTDAEISGADRSIETAKRCLG
jgi:hypothetical protein